jgi:peptide-methionine (S)-S-oxide reductase
MLCAKRCGLCDFYLMMPRVFFLQRARWSIELAYQREPGVLATCVGYTKGDMEYPTYAKVCSEETGHTEACMVVFDPTQVTYIKLADLLFDRIPDPTMLNRV